MTLNKLTQEYKDYVASQINFVAKLQTIIAVISAVFIYFIPVILSKELKEFKELIILGALISISSGAFIGKKLIKNFETKGWAKRHKNFDFSGKWIINTEYLLAVTPDMIGQLPLPPENTGEVIFEQTLFELTLISAKIYSKIDGKLIGGWTWVTNQISEDGVRIFAVFEMNNPPDKTLRNQRSHGYGFEYFEVTAWENNNHTERPSDMVCYWYDCLRQQSTEPFYIGRTTYKRKTD